MKTALMILLICIPIAAEDAKSDKPPAGARAAQGASQTPQPATKAAPSPAKPEAQSGGSTVVQTPFGPTLRSTAPEPAQTAMPNARSLADDPMMRVETSGDTVIFRRQTPFGDQVWRRKRSELNEAERALVEAHGKKPVAPASGPAATR